MIEIETEKVLDPIYSNRNPARFKLSHFIDETQAPFSFTPYKQNKEHNASVVYIEMLVTKGNILP